MRETLTPTPLADIEAARARLQGIALRTPLVRLGLPDASSQILLKLENLQPIGSFKLRGAANAMAVAGTTALANGVHTASAGNMAQGAGLGCSADWGALSGHRPGNGAADQDRGDRPAGRLWEVAHEALTWQSAECRWTATGHGPAARRYASIPVRDTCRQEPRPRATRAWVEGSGCVAIHGTD